MDSSVEFYRRILDNLFDGIYFVDRSRKILYWNQSAEKITGYFQSEIVGKCCFDNILVHVDEMGDNLCKSKCPLSEAVENGRTLEKQVFLLHKNGHRVPVLVRTMPLRNLKGEIVGAVEVFNDNTPQRKTDEKMRSLAKLAFSDEATGLANRRYLEMKLSSMLDEMKKGAPPFGLLLIHVEHADYTKRGAISSQSLEIISNTLTAASQAGEILGVWEKPVFAAIVPNTRRSLLLLLSDKFRALILRSNLYDFVPLVSIGGTFSKKGDTAETVVERALELVEACRKTDNSTVMVENK